MCCSTEWPPLQGMPQPDSSFLTLFSFGMWEEIYSEEEMVSVVCWIFVGIYRTRVSMVPWCMGCLDEGISMEYFALAILLFFSFPFFVWCSFGMTYRWSDMHRVSSSNSTNTPRWSLVFQMQFTCTRVNTKDSDCGFHFEKNRL